MTEAAAAQRHPPYERVAAALQAAARCRRDVKRISIRPTPDVSVLLLVDVEFFTPGKRLRREASAHRVLDGRTCRQVLDDWFGPEATPAEQHILDQTPAELAQTTPPPLRSEAASGLAWNRRPAPATGGQAMPPPSPRNDP